VGVRLYVERHNRRAQRVYAALGMRPAGYLVFEQGD
jgi:RimJ/RimL family protein N-acetyltransferase